MGWTRALIGLGSSLEDRAARMSLALSCLAADPGLRLLRHSRLYRSRPMGPARGGFFNAVALVETRHSPRGLLALCKRIEQRLGRRPGPRWVDRPIDLDLLWMEGVRRGGGVLILPHPGLLARDFVLLPALEVGTGLPLAGGARLLPTLRPTIQTGACPLAPGDPLGQPWPASAPPRGDLPDGGPALPGILLEAPSLDALREHRARGLVDGLVLRADPAHPGAAREELARWLPEVSGPVLVVLDLGGRRDGGGRPNPGAWAGFSHPRLVLGLLPEVRAWASAIQGGPGRPRLAFARAAPEVPGGAAEGRGTPTRVWDLDEAKESGAPAPGWARTGITRPAELEHALLGREPRLGVHPGALAELLSLTRALRRPVEASGRAVGLR